MKTFHLPQDFYSVICISFCDAVTFYRPEKNVKFSTFAYRVMYKKLKSYYKKLAREIKIVSIDDFIPNTERVLFRDIIPDVWDYEREAILNAELEKMDLLQREIWGFMLRGMNGKDISRHTGINKSTISREVFKIKKVIKE